MGFRRRVSLHTASAYSMSLTAASAISLPCSATICRGENFKLYSIMMQFVMGKAGQTRARGKGSMRIELAQERCDHSSLDTLDKINKQTCFCSERSASRV